MPFALTINVTDRATPRIEQLESQTYKDATKVTAGGSVMRQILDHLTALDSERPNALGGRRTHFYAGAGKSTSYQISDTGAIVSIHSVGIAQRYFGGEIKAEPGHLLTVPARAEAHGRRAREFNNLEMLFGRNGPYALAERQAITFSYKRGKKSGDRQSKIGNLKSVGSGIFYWLVQSVTQDPDHSVLPDMASMEATALSAVEKYVTSILNRKP